METSEDSPAATAPPQPEPPYALIRDGLRAGKVIPFLGAGASRLRTPSKAVWSSPGDDFLPSAGELANYLCYRSSLPPAEAVELAWAAQYFEVVAGRASLDDHLHEIFARRYRPGSVHRFLADIPGLLPS